MRAKLRGIIESMRLAWDKGIRKLCVQTDTRAAVSLLEDSVGWSHRHSSLVDLFHSLKNRDWEITIYHIYLELNNVADFLASLAHDLDLGTHVFPFADNNLPYWLIYDQIGVCLPRSINNIS
ncbi:Putative ribonuclease H protein At1g65750 [Linum perenne]